MSKRRNKNNKGQNAGKGGKQAKPASPAVSAAPAVAELAETPSAEEFASEDLSAMLASAELTDEAPSDADDSRSESDAQASADTAAGETQAVEDVIESDGSAGEDHATRDADAHDALPDLDPGEGAWSQSTDSMEPVVARSPVVEFEDASAALAQAIQLEPSEVPEASAIPSIPMPDVSAVDLEMGEDVASTWDSVPADEAESMDSEQSQAPIEDAAVAPGAVGKGRKKLKLNKLQKHTRSTTEAEAPAPEPVPAPVVPRAPREPRIPAFSKLTEYQRLSLAHVPGLPEESDVPGHWRGVGFGIGGRRLVSAFDEVVEIMRLPQITHVPGTQPWMLGVANVRGTLLPVVDLKQFLEGERTVMHEGQRVLVVRQAGGNVAVLIDQLFGQRSFNDSQKSDLTAASGTRYDHFIKQFYRVGDNDWGVFSMSMLTRTPEFRQAAA